MPSLDGLVKGRKQALSILVSLSGPGGKDSGLKNKCYQVPQRGDLPNLILTEGYDAYFVKDFYFNVQF